MTEKKNDEGFLLIELLITITILGMVLMAVVGIAMVVFQAKREANQALQNSADVQVVSTYFGDDVAGSTNSPAAVSSMGSFVLSGTDWSSGGWSHTYSLNTGTHVLTRDGVTVASNIYSASFACYQGATAVACSTSGPTVWTLSLKGCVLPLCTSGVSSATPITATKRF
jgi:type II secretory pathway pseudopilin PulG